MKKFWRVLPYISNQKGGNSRLSRCYATSKKDMSHPISPKYNVKAVESGWYEWWEDNGFFRREDSQEKFVMILPPPNVTGHLHLGHALTCTIQDVFARWHQMNGKKVVWVPGCDHAGIGTQVVVERHIHATKQVTRHQLGREKFVAEILKWKEQKGTNIYEQMKRLGVSLDWDRAFYTMDENICNAVNETFIRLFDSGLIYRKMSLVNWCCELQSVISSMEVENLELKGPTPIRVPGYKHPVTFGKIYDFAYEICGSDEVIVVSTTRPETMLGDTAVMVHPEDSRYMHLVGKKVYHPFRKEEIRIIADTSVDKEIGTGAVKVTPAHSTEDFEVGMRHDLPLITILDESGKINLSEFKGQPRYTARESVLEALDQLGLYRGCRPHPMVIPVCSRSNDIIEPLLKYQWFVNVKEMEKEAIAAVENGELEIYPKNYKIVWHESLSKNVHDWCISRQLWWGHRIPAYCIEVDGTEKWIAASSKEEAKKKFLDDSGLTEDQIKSIKQDDDVLDTWFSSGILPFAALGWAQNTNDYNHLYPTTLLETGHDILFLWVGRMVMLGLQLTGKLPFKQVLLHGLIRDARGEKMSKSKGNVIDPMDVIYGASLEVLQERISRSEKEGILTKQDAEESAKYQRKSYPKGIPEYGADALRLYLCSFSLESPSFTVNVNNVEENFFLCNKIWQVMRFFMLHLDSAHIGVCSHINFSQSSELQVMDRWILSQLSHLVSSSQTDIAAFKLHHVVKRFGNFWRNILCDVYLESIKPILKSSKSVDKYTSLQVLWTCMDVCFRLISPFMPYLTEELYHRLPHECKKEDSILKCFYPQENEWNCWRNPSLDTQVEILLEVTKALRSMKTTHDVSSCKPMDIQGSVSTTDEKLTSFLRESTSVIQTLSRIGLFVIYEPPNKPPAASSVTTISEKINVYLHLEGLVDPVLELERLQKKIEKLKKSEGSILKEMSHKRYHRTPLRVQEKLEKKLKAITDELEQLAAIMKTVQEL